MMKIAFAVAIAAAVLTPAPLLVGTIPAEAQTLRMAQGVDVQIGRDRDRPRRNDSDVTVGIGSGGVTVGPRQNCRMVTTTVERADGRSITRKERRWRLNGFNRAEPGGTATLFALHAPEARRSPG